MILGRAAAVVGLIVFAPAALHAQGGAVTGTVVEAASGRPLPAVTVTLRSAADTSRVLRALTGADGRFRIAVSTPGTYTLDAAGLGYAPQRRTGVAVAAAPVDVGTIRLAASAIQLQGLEARAERSNVIVAPDRTIYSTRDMPVASGGMATDVLRSVPELDVDVNGGVQLRGTAAQIYLNGRPAPMQGESLELFLQQFPADRIDRIEVLPNPSARFEAEGAGGIVNIVLKRDVELGLSGNVFANAGSRGEVGGGGRLAYQRGSLTLLGGGFVRRSDRRTTSYDLRRNLLAEPVYLLEQEGWTDREGLSGNLDLTAELALSGRSTLWSTLGMWRNGFDSDGVTLYTRMDTLGAVAERYDRASLDERRRLSANLSAGFSYSFATAAREADERRREGGEGRGAGPGGRGHGGGRPGGGGWRGGGGGGGRASGGVGGGPGAHELTVEVEYDREAEDDWSRVRRQLLGVEGDPLDLPVQLTLDDSEGRERELQLSLGYVRPWGPTGSIELGYRAEVQDEDDDRLLQVFAEGAEPAPGAGAATGYGFRETFHSAYATLSRTVGALSVQAGVRAERADTRLELAESPEVYENGYLSLFPSANLRYDLGGGRELRLQYSRRVRRPGPWVLNPVDRSNDPLNRNVGNPELEPQYSQSVSLEAGWSGSLGSVRVSPYYRRTDDDWARIRRVDEQGVSTETWENLATVEQMGASLTLSMRPLGGVSGSLSLTGAHEVRDAGNLAQDYSGEATWWNARGNVSARVTERLAVQGMFYYRPARDVAQGRTSSSLMTHVGLRQQVGKRGTLNLMMMDPFDLYRSSFESRDPSFVQIGRSRWSARAAVLSFSYSFGRPPRVRDRGRQNQGEPEPQELPDRPGAPEEMPGR